MTGVIFVYCIVSSVKLDLHHILSFLPTKISVSTSVLAKRWRFLWAYVPTIDLSNDTNIVNKVMSLYKAQSMDTFRLRFADADCSRDELETWIATAIERNVKNVDLDLHEDIWLPLSLFTCTTLVDLSLTCSVPNPVNVYLPCLKKLRLMNTVFYSDSALPTLLSGCQVLEELIMGKIVDSEMVWCCIISPTIKRLTVHFVSLLYGFDNHRLEINAPALTHLKLCDTLSEHVAAQMLASLIEADIFLDYHVDVGEGHSYFVSMLNFVDSLYNVKFLKLSSRKMFPVAVFVDHQSKCNVRFHNLIKLELAADCVFLTKLLEGAHNLEVLIIREVYDSRKRWMEVIDSLKHWMEPKRVPICLSTCLKTIKIDQFGFTEREFDMVEYVLRNAKVLKLMEIFFRDWIDSNTKFDARRRISSFHHQNDTIVHA